MDDISSVSRPFYLVPRDLTEDVIEAAISEMPTCVVLLCIHCSWLYHVY